MAEEVKEVVEQAEDTEQVDADAIDRTSELVEFANWAINLVGAEDSEQARELIGRAVQVEKVIPQMGVAAMLVGPGGLLGVATTPNLMNIEGFENIEGAALDLQRNILAERRKMREDDARARMQASEENEKRKGRKPKKDK